MAFTQIGNYNLNTQPCYHAFCGSPMALLQSLATLDAIMSPEGNKGLQTKPSRRVLDLTQMTQICADTMHVICGHLCSVVNYLRRVSLLRPMKLAIGRNLVAASIAYRL